MENEERIYYGFLSGNAIKLAACALMFVDHLGMIVFPEVRVLRIIGRLSMPLFAFMFAEGCRYTRSKLRHLLTVLILGLVTSGAASIALGMVYGDMLISFSLSALIIYSVDMLKKRALVRDGKGIALSSAAIAGSVALAAALCCFIPGVTIDYGLAGVLLPVTVRLLDFRSYGYEGVLGELFNHATALLCFACGLAALSIALGGTQPFCMLSLVPLMFYGGRRGKLKMKYFFYIFYPAHFIVIGAIFLLLNPGFLESFLDAI